MSSTAEYVLSFDALAIMILPTITETEQAMSSSTQIVSEDLRVMSYILPNRPPGVTAVSESIVVNRPRVPQSRNGIFFPVSAPRFS